MTSHQFGNDPEKIDRYRAFWDRSPVDRPLVGFTRVGWFPLSAFAAAAQWQGKRYLEPEDLEPDRLVADHIRMIEEGNDIDDDLIRGVGPMQVAVPFVPGIVGCRARVLPENVMGEEEHRGWSELLELELDRDNRWYRKYLELAEALAAEADGRFPVSHGAEIGPTDMHAVLRGHAQSIVDLVEEPEKSAELLDRCGRIFRDLTADVWRRLPRFHGGYFDAQYSLWAPGTIVRMQEDATAVYSPDLYRRLVQPVDRMIARSFECSFMHLHSTSMFLLDAFLEIDEIRCYEVNNDASGPPLLQMVPHFRKIQAHGKPLLIRGSFAPEEIELLTGKLEPHGLFLLIMVRDHDEIEQIRRQIEASSRFSA